MTGQEQPKRQPSADALWRIDYRQRRHDQRVATVQPDLFGAPAIELFHPNTMPRPAPRSARNFKPRPDLTPAELTALVGSARNWHHVGQRARISAESPSQYAGRVGVIWRRCSPVFADHVYLSLDPVGKETSDKIAFVELRDVEPVGE